MQTWSTNTIQEQATMPSQQCEACDYNQSSSPHTTHGHPSHTHAQALWAQVSIWGRGALRCGVGTVEPDMTLHTHLNSGQGCCAHARTRAEELVMLAGQCRKGSTLGPQSAWGYRYPMGSMLQCSVKQQKKSREMNVWLQGMYLLLTTNVAHATSTINAPLSIASINSGGRTGGKY